MRRRSLVFFFLTFAYLLSQFLRHANAAIAESVAQDLSLTAAQLGLMTSLFYATFALAQVPVGVALDRRRPRFVIAGLMLVGSLGCLVFASAGSLAVLASGRALIGLGMAGVLMGSLKILRRWYPARRFATVSGLLVGLGALGGMVAASPLAWFSQSYGWRAAFTLSAVAVLVSGACVAVFVRDRPPGSSDELPGSQRGHVREVFTDLKLWRLGPLNFFLCGTLMAFQGLWAGPFLRDVHGLSATGAGTYLTILSAGVVVGYLIGGWLADRFGIFGTIMVSGALFVIAQVVIILSVADFVPWLLAGAYFVFGFAGAFQLLTLVQVGLLFPLSMSGRAVTAVNFFGFGGTAILQWVMGVIIGSFARQASGAYPPVAYVTALSLTTLGTVAVLLWYIPARSWKSTAAARIAIGQA